MREIRPSSLEGGVAVTRHPYPYVRRHSYRETATATPLALWHALHGLILEVRASFAEESGVLLHGQNITFENRYPREQWEGRSPTSWLHCCACVGQKSDRSP